MKTKWWTKPLGELARIRTGKKNVNQGNPRGAYPFFTCAAEHTYSDSYSFDAEALLVAGNGNVGQVRYFRGKFEAYQRTYVISDFSGVLPRYLYWLLDGKLKEQISGLKLGNTMPYIKIGMLAEFMVPVPPLAEQQRIVGILDAAFAAIGEAQVLAEQNLQNARALFASQLQSVFTGKRRAGWVERTMGEACFLRSGTTLPREIEKNRGEIPYLKVADMNMEENLGGITCSSRYLDRDEVSSSRLLPVGTTIFPRRGGAILTNKKRLTTRVVCADLNIMGVIPKPGLLPEFLFNYFLHLDLRKINNGSSMPQINNRSIAPLPISFPESTSAQQSIVARLGALSEETRRLESLYRRKLDALVELKQSLLQQALGGRL